MIIGHPRAPNLQGQVEEDLADVVAGQREDAEDMLPDKESV